MKHRGFHKYTVSISFNGLQMLTCISGTLAFTEMVSGLKMWFPKSIMPWKATAWAKVVGGASDERSSHALLSHLSSCWQMETTLLYLQKNSPPMKQPTKPSKVPFSLEDSLSSWPMPGRRTAMQRGQGESDRLPLLVCNLYLTPFFPQSHFNMAAYYSWKLSNRTDSFPWTPGFLYLKVSLPCKTSIK